MPPKQKLKKGGLDDNQIQTTIRIVKQYWPNYAISVADIRNPTRDFVIKLYMECVINLDDKCAFLTRTNPVSYPPGLGEEEYLYLKLSRIPSLINADFKLGDLFTFDPIRLNNHIFVVMHFLIFTETKMDKMVEICNSVFNANERMQQNKEELEVLKEERSQKQINLTLAKAERKKLKEALALITPKYEETLELVSESEHKCKDLLLEIEKLTAKLEIELKAVEELEHNELELRKKIVTEEEYNNLKSTLDSLIKEEQNLEEIDLHNGLFEQKQQIEQLQMCLQELNHLQMPEELNKLSVLRIQLKSELQNLECAVATQETSEAEMKQLKMQLEEQLHLYKSENKKLQETLRLVMENALLEEKKCKQHYEKAFKTNLNQIEALEKELEQIKADHKRLENGLAEQYEIICQKQDNAVENFQNFLNRVRDELENNASNKN